ncbi:hypothetical protein TKK_0004356 [Trichogramma kaykai]|uniref:RING-type domain-containing protein n=1 Tax=Trichogramma kaykai TaxID=54128 RepID=A0ABD2XMD1_9HYME
MEQFEQLLTCAICLDRYRNPKLLPCQHSFCMEPCMDGLVDYVRRQVKCPECRAEHRIPYQGVQAFPTNVTLQRFLELHIEITGELPDPTSGQIMERCSVCSEKSYCNTCAHCEKKCCPECKDEHVKILRKNIVSINSQVRRALHRLQETLAQVEKNTVALQTNAASVSEEVDEIYRRLNKALKDRTEVLRGEIDRYLGQELKSLIHLKENLEQEIANIQSNCDLADQHINENVPWDDNELLDTKELFLRTLEFIRNFEYEAGDYTRRMRFVMTHEPNQLVLHVAGYGELNIKPEGNTSALLGGVGGGSGVGGSSSLAVPGSGGSPGLMRSKSDHRLASQYRSQQDDDRSHGRNRYVPDYEYDTPEYEAPRSRSRYRSRFMRNREGDDSDGGDGGGVSGQNTSTTSGRSGASVRFNAPNSGGGDHHHHHSAREHRERVLDTEDASRGPLSGIFRLTDSPRVIKKLNECERAGKRKKSEQQQTAQQQQAAAANQPKQQIQPGQGRNKSTPFVGRQVSEDDEISRIKKLNKNAPGEPRQQQQTTTPAATAAVQESLAEQERRAATPTSTASPAARRTTSRERDTELAEETSVSSSSRKTPSSRKTSSELHGSGTGVAGGRSNSSESTGSTESAGGGGSSIRSTGAPFTTEEMKQKFLARSPQNTSSSTTAGSLGSNRSSPVTSTNAATTTTPRPFQSRFLGNRTTTPAPSTTAPETTSKTSSSNGSSSLTSTPAAVSKSRSEEEDDDDDEEETSSSSEETESESEEDSEPEATPATPTRSSVPSSPLSSTGTGGGGYKRNESAMSRTDIGPLLARSAEARRGSKEDSPSTRQASAAATAAQNDSNELLLSSSSSSSSPAALDDAQAVRENETNRKLESKRIFQARKKAFKKTAGRVAIGVCETLFG